MLVSIKTRGGVPLYKTWWHRVSKEELLLSRRQKGSRTDWQNTSAQRVISPTGGRGITVTEKSESTKAFPLVTVAQGKWGLWGVPDKGKSLLIRSRWGRDRDLLEPPGRHLGPLGLLTGMCHIRGLGHQDLFQKWGPGVSQAVAERSGFGERK